MSNSPFQLRIPLALKRVSTSSTLDEEVVNSILMVGVMSGRSHRREYSVIGGSAWKEEKGDVSKYSYTTVTVVEHVSARHGLCTYVRLQSLYTIGR